MTTMSVSEVRARLHEALERVARGEEVRITRHGVLAAVIVAPSRTRADVSSVRCSAELQRLLQDFRSGRRPREQADVSAEDADEWVREIRAHRDAEGE